VIINNVYYIIVEVFKTPNTVSLVMPKRKEYKIPKSHPRYVSLMLREAITDGVEEGITAPEGLIAHGRGEAFDYLLGERTQPPAKIAIEAAAAELLLAKNPVLSVNGNVAALAPEEMVKIAIEVPAKIEVNIFHYSKERLKKIVKKLLDAGASNVLGEKPDEMIPGLDHARAACTKKGIYSADVVLVPLEDGDRAQALRKMGKTVITIDLNPLSRTAKECDITLLCGP
jgi:4-phosphopantoate--beta-alanine ligase